VKAMRSTKKLDIQMSKTQMVGARVDLDAVEEISKAVESGYYLTLSHFIKKAIERELERLKRGTSRMAKASTPLQDESQPPQESILPRVNESFPEWSKRIDAMLQEFRAREDRP